MDLSEQAKILIVDDESSKLLSLRAVLEDLGQQIVTATSGRDALRILLNEDFALILLDVNMPDIDGFETAALIRRRKRSEHVPIIFVTSYYDDARALQSYSLGAVDYLMTPFVPEILKAKVRVFVDLFQMQQQVKQQAEERVALAHEQSARQAAEKANRSKSEFLANISHELRTPMNAIIGMTQLALDESISEEARDYLLTAQTSAHSLLGLLNEILDLSRLESGKFVLESVSLDLGRLVEETVKGLSVRAYEKGIECSCWIDESVPKRLLGDPLRLRQILTNLLGNAIKFTHAGEIAIRVEALSSREDSVGLKFMVSDTGIGISAADQERIFAPFTQADSSMTRRYGGTGLGLAIVTDLVNLMNGRIWLESRVEAGTTFYFTVDARIDPASPPAAPPSTSRAFTGEIPVLDSRPEHGKTLKEFLRRSGALPLLTNSEEEFVNLLRSRGPGNPWPLALVTWPNGSDRFLVLLEEVLLEGLTREVLILISGSDRQRLAEWLAQRPQIQCLEKPLLSSELAATLSGLLTPRESRPSSTPARGEMAPRSEQALRVLVAEDTPANQKLISAVLSKRGHFVQIARDGREAIDFAVSQPFDVILMDVQMPVMDGLQATAEIRERTTGWPRRIPIVAMTAHAMEGDRERFLAAGMDDYFAKPIHLPRLIEFLESRTWAEADRDWRAEPASP